MNISNDAEVTKPKFIDLFAGCGGLSLGLSNAGWRGVFAVEKDPMAFETLRANLVDSTVRAKFLWPEQLPKRPLQVQKLLSDYPLVIRRMRGNVDLIAGGPPCQGFSSAGKRDGADPRNQMLQHYVQMVRQVRPKFILMENVQGIASKHQGEKEAYADILLRKLAEIGYVCESRILRASDYGVPQERPRFILLGVDLFAFPALLDRSVLPAYWDVALEKARDQFFATVGLTKKTISCSQAISDLETKNKSLEACPDAPGRMQVRYAGPITAYQQAMHGTTSFMDSMRLARHSAKTIERFEWIQKSCGAGVNVGSLDLGKFATRKHTQALMDGKKPSRTLTTLPDDLIHYSEPRILTVREYARLQSFPDWFKFYGKYTTGGERRTQECPRYTQIGNAVAPFVAQTLGYAINHLAAALSKLDVGVSAKTKATGGWRPALPAGKTGNSGTTRVWRIAGG